MINQATQPNSITEEEIAVVVNYFKKLGYKPNKKTEEKLIQLTKEFPDKDFVACAREMYEWFDEANRKIKSFHLTFRNWVKKDYAPKKQKSAGGFFERNDLY